MPFANLGSITTWPFQGVILLLSCELYFFSRQCGEDCYVLTKTFHPCSQESHVYSCCPDVKTWLYFFSARHCGWASGHSSASNLPQQQSILVCEGGWRLLAAQKWQWKVLSYPFIPCVQNAVSKPFLKIKCLWEDKWSLKDFWGTHLYHLVTYFSPSCSIREGSSLCSLLMLHCYVVLFYVNYWHLSW